MSADAIVKVPHADLGEDTYHEWWFTGRLVRADAIGRLNERILAADWLDVRCNNLDCPGLALVRKSVITDAVEVISR